MAKTVSIISHKGGVGKTITAVNLSAALAMAGKRTILVDCDPQGSATAIAGIHGSRGGLTLEDGLTGRADADEIMVQSCLYYLKVIPAPKSLGYPNGKLVWTLTDPNLLSRFLYEQKWFFDYIVIDTPASFNMLTRNAIFAANTAIIPVQCEYLSFRSLEQTMRWLMSIKKEHHPSLKLSGVLLTMYDSSTRISNLILNNAKRHLGSRLFHTVIPQNQKIRESPALQKPLVVDDVQSVGAKCYLDLANELMGRN